MNPNDPNNPNPAPAPGANPTPPAQPTQGVSMEQFQKLQGDLQEMQTFVTDASFIIGEIYKDPTLRTQVQGKLSGNPPQNPPQNPSQNPQPKFDPYTGQPLQPQNPPQNPAPQNPQGDKRVDSMEMKMREDIVQRVESKYGYTNLAPEQRKALRKAVEKNLNGWGGSVITSPVDQLPKLLEDAYMLADLPKAREEGRVEGLIQARQNDMGALPGMQTQQPAQDTTQLSSEQQELSKKWGLNQDRVSEKLKEFQETGVITYKPPTPQNAAPQNPAPSGNPTPPAPNQPQQ